ncbi:hypothetical protein K4L06_15400 [Lysobacter sp. BMK333-48F3]|uniref:methyltransferase domain-containing protein n=1 Tax=Lysobacter sp. BMK333-48F3 TaxID=2867962 RepID=UPI001C8C3B26|nr:methyltransferase domain-containing protein [Lysobacter sp. BMK333-48F3]MBX9402694.1 hypothetical protein [Lysobacter sp. BMK333-48F3]
MEQLSALLAQLGHDSALEQPDRVPARLDALDRIDAWLPHATDVDLRRRAQAAADRFEALNAAFYDDLRQDIRNGHGAARLLHYAAAWAREVATSDPQAYDLLDELIAGVLPFGEPQAPQVALAPDMVFYQPTPARHILAMIRASELGAGDVLVDLGSGLGHVPLLAAICTSAETVGIELEPAYVAYARRAAADLHLAKVRFVEADARHADVSSGTVFYLYTPFQGAILAEVLERLHAQAAHRAIRVCSFGPCTPTLAAQPWLARQDAGDAYGPALFHSVAG